MEERPLHELFCGFWQCQDTTHDTKPNGKKTYQACWRSCYSRCCCCCCCSTRSSSKGAHAMRQTKQNKTKRSKVEWSGVEWSAGSSSYTRNKIQLIFKREIAVNNSTEQSVAAGGEGVRQTPLGGARDNSTANCPRRICRRGDSCSCRVCFVLLPRMLCPTLLALQGRRKHVANSPPA